MRFLAFAFINHVNIARVLSPVTPVNEHSTREFFFFFFFLCRVNETFKFFAKRVHGSCHGYEAISAGSLGETRLINAHAIHWARR